VLRGGSHDQHAVGGLRRAGRGRGGKQELGSGSGVEASRAVAHAISVLWDEASRSGEAGAGVEASRGGGDSRDQHAEASRSRAEEASRSGEAGAG
jgi:hypothetical protein